MEYIKRMIKEYWKITLLLGICCLVIFYEYLFKDRLFEFIADQQLQYHLFYEEWARLLTDFIKTGEWPFYSWYTFLGSDFFASKMYYVIFDFFMPVIMLFDDVSKCMMYVTIVLVIMSGISMKTYLSAFQIKKDWVKDLIAMIYALSGIATLYYGNYMFHRFYAILPFLFAGVEFYQNCGKKVLFSFIVFLLFTQNYYFMFPTSLFLVGYYIASKYSKGEHSIVLILKSALPLIGAYFIGLFMAGIVLVPTAMFLMTSPRMGNASLELFWEPKVYLGILCNWFVSPFSMYTDIPYPFYNGSNGHGHWYSLYATALIPVLFCSSLSRKNRKLKPFVVCLLTYTAILMVKPLNSVMHGFSEASFRWVFLLVFLTLSMAALIMEDNLFENHRAIKGYLVFLICFLVMLFCFSRYYGWDFKEYQIYLFVLACELLAGFVYLLFLYRKRSVIVFGLVVLELILTNRAILNIYSSNYYRYEDSLNKEYVQYFLNTEENQMARIYLDPMTLRPFSAMNMNQSLNYQYMSTVAYDSTYESILTDFLSWNEIYWHIIDLKNHDILRMLGVKYVGVFDESELPDDSGNYMYSFNLNAYQMYELPEYNRIAHTYSTFITKSDFEKLEDKLSFDWNHVLIVPDESMSLMKHFVESEKSQFEVIEHSNNRMYGHIENQNEAVLFTAIPYSDGWKVYSETESLKTINVNGGFLGVVLPAGDHYLTYQYTSPGFKPGILLSLIGFIVFFVQLVLDYRKQEIFKKNAK